MIWITVSVLVFQIAVLICQHRRLEYWKRQAMANARARLTKDAACNVEKQEINRKAGRAIAQLNAQVKDLTAEIKRLRNINRNLLKQMDKRKEAADHGDS